MTGRITGILAAAVTPLRDGGARLDEPAIASLHAFYRVAGLDGLLVCGTTGEGILLTDAERPALLPVHRRRAHGALRRRGGRLRGRWLSPSTSTPPAPGTRSR